ncbi:helix-turn-helix transcriptional regulator [Pedobacter sp. AW1-32]|uniref:helix-turn-helix transcriptional regulator n=1 Tax=Pedobacter sp. AW1-32 TaxID=3383026 RepID=UPI003FF1335B
MIDIGITLRKYRDRFGYTQQYVANCLDISRVTYRKWENNGVEFSITQLQKISEMYEVSIDQLIKESYTVVDYLQQFTNSKGKTLTSAIRT